jgi:hypothetical protein
MASRNTLAEIIHARRFAMQASYVWLWRDSAALLAIKRVSYAPAVQTWIFSAISMAAPASGAQRRGPFFGSRTTVFEYSVTRSSGMNAIRMLQPA